jgi:hypothetical protein
MRFSSSSTLRRGLSTTVAALVLAGVAAGPFAGTASAAPSKKPKRITDLSLTATVPDGSGGTKPLTAGQSTTATSATFTFTSAVTGAHYTCRLDGATGKACTSPVTRSGLAQGSHTFAVTEAARGYRSKTVSLTWKIDLTPPPAVTFNAFTSPAKTSPAITFTGETGDTFTCAIDAAAAVACTPGNTGTSAVTGEGPHTLTVVATDPAGNVGPAAVAHWVIDTTAPSVLIQDSPASPNNASSESIHFSVAGADAATHAVQCKLARGSTVIQALADCTSPYTATTSTDATYTMTVVATDLAGNQTTVTATWTRDSSAPAAPVITGPATPTNQTHVTFTWPDVAGSAGYECALDSNANAAFSSCVSGVTADVTAEGSHTYYVRSHDAVPNTSAPSMWTWVVDTTAPTLDVTGVPSGVTSSADVSPVVTVTDANPTAATCTLDGPSPSSTCGSYTGLADGDYTLTVNETDAAGNAATPVVLHWTVDTTPPTVTLKAPSSLSGPVRAAFSEPVTGLTSGGLVLTTADDSTAVTTARHCTLAGALVACAATFDAATLLPTHALMPGQHYLADLGAAATHDAAGNPVADTSLAFRGALVLPASSVAAHYTWATVKTATAIGGRYRVDHLAGARSSWTFRGATLKWWTRTGPAQGRARVYVDGKRIASVNNYARQPHARVARVFRKLGSGRHTVTIAVLGVKGARRATGTFVAVDAFTAAGHRTGNPVLQSRWGRLKHVVVDDVRGAAVSVTFRGTGFTWVTHTGARQGKAVVFVDGVRTAVVDNYAAGAGSVKRRSLTGLTDAVHTVQVVVLGQHHTGAKGNRVIVERFRIA